MRRATADDAAAVDALILQSCTHRWRKVAMVVATSSNEFDAQFPHLPYVYMPIRIIAMEQSGVLEVHGDAMAMRFSEVRLAGGKCDGCLLLGATEGQAAQPSGLRKGWSE